MADCAISAAGGGCRARGTRSRQPPRVLLLLNERRHANPLAGGAEAHLFEAVGRLLARGATRVEPPGSGFPSAVAQDAQRAPPQLVTTAPRVAEALA